MPRAEPGLSRRSPLTDPRALLGSLGVHALLLLLTSTIVLSVVGTGQQVPKTRLSAQLDPVDNRAAAVDGPGGGPGEAGGLGPPPEVSLAADPDSRALDPALLSVLAELQPEVVGNDQLRDLPIPDTRGVGTAAGAGLGGGGGLGGGSGGGVGPGFGPRTEFFGAEARASSFAYVIDRSGSMSEFGALGRAKRELLQSLRRLPPDARFAVLFYDLQTREMASARGETGLMPATRENQEAIATQLAAIDAGGGTDHVRALRTAFATDAQVVFFLTDAQQLSRYDVDDLRAEAGSARLMVVQFGVGPDTQAPDPLRTLALLTGGTYHYVDVAADAANDPGWR